jgi:hypothetical protein
MSAIKTAKNLPIKLNITDLLKKEFDGLTPPVYIQNAADCCPPRKEAWVGKKGHFYTKKGQ